MNCYARGQSTFILEPFMAFAFKFLRPLALIFTLLFVIQSQKVFCESDSTYDISSNLDFYSVKDKYLAAQKDLLARNKLINEPYTFTVLEHAFIGLPNVFSPKACGENGFFVEKVPINSGDIVLEVGAGTGFFPIFAVLKGAQRVIATDISSDAIKNIIENAKLHGMESQILAAQSDVFNEIPEDLKFDVIYWNIPFTPTMEKDLTLLDLMVFDPENKFLERYLADSAAFLKPNGRLFLGYSSTHGDVAKMKEIAKRNHWNVELVAQKGNEDTIIVELYEFKSNFVSSNY